MNNETSDVREFERFYSTDNGENNLNEDFRIILNIHKIKDLTELNIKLYKLKRLESAIELIENTAKKKKKV